MHIRVMYFKFKICWKFVCTFNKIIYNIKCGLKFNGEWEQLIKFVNWSRKLGIHCNINDGPIWVGRMSKSFARAACPSRVGSNWYNLMYFFLKKLKLLIMSFLKYIYLAMKSFEVGRGDFLDFNIYLLLRVGQFKESTSTSGDGI